MEALLLKLSIIAGFIAAGVNGVVDQSSHHHHHHHHHHHVAATASKQNHLVAAPVQTQAPEPAVTQADIAENVRHLETELASKEVKAESLALHGKLTVNCPLPDDFSDRFVKAAAKAASCEEAEVKLLETHPLNDEGTLAEIIFKAPKDVVQSIQDQAGDEKSALVSGPLHDFLVQRDSASMAAIQTRVSKAAHKKTRDAEGDENPVEDKGIDVDTSMPYGELEAFGREDTAQELTESSIKESDEMVDQLERAEVAEEKRAVFRALTRLRGAAITSFDGVARSQTGNIDEYNKVHKWRNTHPLQHLADEESDVSKWAFPDSADF